jgi:histidinol-phosphatase
MTYSTELKRALESAKIAGSIQLEKRHILNRIEKKIDRSPVTEIDKECEAQIKAHLLTHFPDDGFLGEETGDHKGKGSRRWIVDPLDGTRPYIRNIPTYSVLISLEVDLKPIVGVIYLPAMGIICYGSEGAGAFLNDQPIHVSQTASLGDSMGSALGFIEKSELVDGKQLFSLMHSWDYMYGFMDAYTYVCVASGKLDLAVNLLDKAWDCSAAACIITEAGGSFSDINGNKSAHNGSIVFSNGKFHEKILHHFKE